MSQHHHDAAPWYAVHCRPFGEQLAATMLTRQLGLNVYLPQLKGRRRGRAVYTPFFPCYLFVQADLFAVAPHRIDATPGVVRLLAFGAPPPPLPAPLIEALREQVDELNRQGGALQHGFQPGELLQLRQGPLQGLEVVFLGPLRPCERVRVLVEFLGRTQVAEVPVDTLERVAAPTAHPPRRSRGRGRPLRPALSLETGSSGEP